MYECMNPIPPIYSCIPVCCMYFIHLFLYVCKLIMYSMRYTATVHVGVVNTFFHNTFENMPRDCLL